MRISSNLLRGKICQQVIMTVHHLTRTLRGLCFQSFKLILAVIPFITSDCKETEERLPAGTRSSFQW